ncbi:uncharacterized protein LOC144491875 [Mustelus asterias]
MEREDSTQGDESDVPEDKDARVTFGDLGQRTPEPGGQTETSGSELSQFPLSSSSVFSRISQPDGSTLSSGSVTRNPSLSLNAQPRSPSPQSRSTTSSVVFQDISVSSDKNLTASPSRQVKFTVTLTLAIPNGHEGDKRRPLKSKSIRTMEASKPQKYYHVEWSLLPNTETTKLDLVTFGSAAKTYMGNDSQILRPWDDGDQMWLVFRHNVDLPVTKELLLKLGSHLMTLQIWESKDKVSSKAKFDRPKGLRLLVEKESTDVEKLLVQEQLKLLENSPLVTTYKELDYLYVEDLSNLLGHGAVPSSDQPNLGWTETLADLRQPPSENQLCADLNQNRQMKGRKKKLGPSSRTRIREGSHKKLKEDKATEKAKEKTQHKTEQQNQKKKVVDKYISGVIKLDTRLLLAGVVLINKCSANTDYGLSS